MDNLVARAMQSQLRQLFIDSSNNELDTTQKKRKKNNKILSLFVLQQVNILFLNGDEIE